MPELHKEDDVVDSFEAYQKSLILRFTDYNLHKPDQDILESICLLDQNRQQNIKLQQCKLIAGIADFLQINVRYNLDCRKRQILFDFKINNMAPFLIQDLSIDFESNLSLISQPYPETSTSLFIKDLPPR